MSGVEWDLWSCLRARRLDGFKFRRKALVGPFILDFVCLSARLVVEIDGELFGGAAGGDGGRLQWLESHGFRVVRLNSLDVSQRMDYVLGIVSAELAARPLFLPGRGYFRGRPSLPRRSEARAP
jgi:very-short-patch-repair endonuclease